MRTELTAGTLLIRPFRAADIDAVYEAVRESIDEVSPWLPWCHPAYKKEETSGFILAQDEARRKDEEFAFGVFDSETGAFLGGVGLNQINRRYGMANLGYWVRTSCAGRGIASLAARRVARFGFEELGLQRIEIIAAAGNRASQRTAEKAGALREGTLRKRLLVNGQPQDAVLYSLVAEDIKKVNSE
jgi:ribosomal-protein-serine acetyltransferase